MKKKIYKKRKIFMGQRFGGWEVISENVFRKRHNPKFVRGDG